MTRGHGWSLAFTMWRTFTSRSMPAFTGAFSLSPLMVCMTAAGHCLPGQIRFFPGDPP